MNPEQLYLEHRLPPDRIAPRAAQRLLGTVILIHRDRTRNQRSSYVYNINLTATSHHRLYWET